MCKSQQVNEITETTESSEEECKLIQSFDSCEEFSTMSIEQNNNQMEKMNKYIEEKMEKNSMDGNIKKTRKAKN